MEIKYYEFQRFIEAIKACQTLDLYYTAEKKIGQDENGVFDYWVIRIDS